MRGAPTLVAAGIAVAAAGCASVNTGQPVGIAEGSVYGVEPFEAHAWGAFGQTHGGGSTGPSPSSEVAFARALEQAFRRVDWYRLGGRRVYVAGLERRDEASALGAPLPPRVAASFAEWAVLGGATVELDPGRAELEVSGTVDVLGAIATHRIYRWFLYPYYVHEEHHGSLRFRAFAIGLSGRDGVDLEGVEQRTVLLESFMFDAIGVTFTF